VGSSKKVVIALAAVAAAAVLGVGVWFFASSNVGEPTDVTAPPIDTTSTTLAAGAGEATTTTSAPEEEGSVVTFELAEGSVARFFIDEVLRGDPITVVAESDQVVGLVQIDLEDLAASQVGTILVNARVFETDQSLRDRAIRGPILDASTHEFIEFAPTSIEGLSGAATVGEELTFTVSGELTIRDVTQPVVFEVIAVLAAEDRLEGVARTVVDRTEFGLVIPSAPGVANVSEMVTLELEFVAFAA
jgi:polyisoprenoid-binding protein YceI